MVASARPSLLVYNTAERLLRGDVFHYTTVPEILEALSDFPEPWLVCGIGTTNWHRRNGELIVTGSAAEPTMLWADPGADPPALISDVQAAAAELNDMTSPSMRSDGKKPQFPFLAVGVCDPESMVPVALSPGRDLHDTIRQACEAHNIGLAGVRLEAHVDGGTYQAACHIPIGNATGGAYEAIVLSTRGGHAWHMTGIYAANPTIRGIVANGRQSVHLHGFSRAEGIGGHIRAAIMSEPAAIELFPLRDFILRISDLDMAVEPVRHLS